VKPPGEDHAQFSGLGECECCCCVIGTVGANESVQARKLLLKRRERRFAEDDNPRTATSRLRSDGAHRLAMKLILRLSGYGISKHLDRRDKPLREARLYTRSISRALTSSSARLLATSNEISRYNVSITLG
jgi:hypothetical protein